MLYSYIYKLHTSLKFPVFIAETNDNIKAIGLIIGALITLAPDTLNTVIFNESLILDYVYQIRIVKTKEYFTKEAKDKSNEYI